MANKFHEITFTESVKKTQEQYCSRRHYAKFENGADTNNVLSINEIEFIRSQNQFYMATVNEAGHPYVQFRGGDYGFLKVLDEKTLGFADFRGNLQYISVGNLSKNNKVALILLDYPSRTRLKILAEAEVKNAKDEPELIEQFKVERYKAKIERAMILHIEAFDWNCPQHIPQRFTIEQIEKLNAPIYEHIEKLEKEIEHLKKANK